MTIRNPQINELKDYCAFRNPIDVDARAKRLNDAVQQGKVQLSNHWILIENEQILSTWSLIAAANIVLLRSKVTISDDSVEKILEHLEASSLGNTVVIKKSSSRLFDAIAVSRGWKLEERSLHFLTLLQGREDLHADGDIQAFPIDKLDSDLFQKFFKKLNSDQSILEVKERFEDYENSSLQVFCQNDQFLAAGVLGFSHDTVVMDVIGVVPKFRNRGIGSRLHQHMMWVGQNLGDSYVGMTDANNVAMLNIFRRNCCVEQDEQVNLCFK